MFDKPQPRRQHIVAATADGSPIHGLSRRRLMQASLGVAAASALSLRAGEAAASGNVAVLYAGSLVNLMEHGIAPAFDKVTGAHFQGFAGGSVLLANQIKGRLRQADVFISAVPKVNHALMGKPNGDWVSWYIAFAESPLVLGYNPSSRFASGFKSMPWYKALQQPGIRIGRTDPKLDPKGRMTVALMKRAAAHYKTPDLAHRILGAPENPAQVLPEEALIGRLQSGQLDVGFFYSTETADAKIPAVHLPPAIAPKAVYTVTVLNNGPNPAGAAQFVNFLLGAQGRTLMHQHGMALRKLELTGDAAKVPPAIRAMLPKAQ